MAQRSGPMVLSTVTRWQKQQPKQRLRVALQGPGPSCVPSPLCPLSGNTCPRVSLPGPPNRQTLEVVLKLGVWFQAQPEKLHRPRSTEVGVGVGGGLPWSLGIFESKRGADEQMFSASEGDNGDGLRRHDFLYKGASVRDCFGVPKVEKEKIQGRNRKR